MFRSRFVGVWVAAVVGLASPLAAQERQPPAPEVRGVIKEVDAAKRTIRLALGEGRQGGEEKTFEVAETAEVGINESLGRSNVLKEGKLADLPAGAFASLVLSADRKKVEFIVAEGPRVQGVVKAVDVAKGTITLAVGFGRGPDGPEEKTFAVAKDAEIAADDGRGRIYSIKEAKLADLAEGTMVAARLSLDQKSVRGLLAEGARVQGTVKAVDADKGTITVETWGARGEAAEEKTFTVAKDAPVVLDDGRGRRFSTRAGKLGDVPTGAVGILRLSPDKTTVTTVRAEGPGVGGTLKEVDAAKGTITLAVRTRDGTEEKTLTLAKDVRVQINAREAKLADLKSGDDVFVLARLSLDQKVVRSVTVAPRRGQ